jgi:hypothetical protein
MKFPVEHRKSITIGTLLIFTFTFTIPISISGNPINFLTDPPKLTLSLALKLHHGLKCLPSSQQR